jgi:hypothetical protein
LDIKGSLCSLPTLRKLKEHVKEKHCSLTDVNKKKVVHHFIPTLMQELWLTGMKTSALKAS